MSEPVRSRALVYDDRVDAAPQVRDTLVRAPGTGEVRVRMRAAGICHSDLHALNGDWPIGQRVVLGHEGAGVVDAVGEGVTHPAVGDLVALNWYAPCRACTVCLRGRPWLCTQTAALENALPGGATGASDADAPHRGIWPYLGVGAYAEYVTVPAHAAVPVPSAVPAAVAALIGCSITTGYGAVRHTADVRPGESAVVVGSGGVGQAIILSLVLAGASTIVVVDRSEQKLRAASELGATHTVLADGSEQERLRELFPEGADVAFDAIGAPSVAGYLPAHVAAGGRCVLVGMPRVGGRAAVDTWDIVTRGISVIGCNYGSAVPERDFPAIAGLYLDGALPLDLLVGPWVSLDDAAAAILALPAHTGGRMVVDLAAI
ncbi:alcohol dehydrogenase catalytic domain-containing protein [Microbacterium sp. 18062]|uniref:alcohol dehydrogenase catalytic domain-containing protein n=1 Tax=Microbacterium sp. 18062 TaxID=2681410 RepID=UPI00135B0FF2|nr:alcohol dehydrogenase catalytic domain-containing protein [Microbacterium sp. 18062]